MNNDSNLKMYRRILNLFNGHGMPNMLKYSSDNFHAYLAYNRSLLLLNNITIGMNETLRDNKEQAQ